MFCPACGNDNVSGSLTCSKCGAALPASPATSPATVSPAAQANAAPLIAGAALAGMGDWAIATILDLIDSVAVSVNQAFFHGKSRKQPQYSRLNR
jgi:zinc-ribbon domain